MRGSTDWEIPGQKDLYIQPTWWHESSQGKYVGEQNLGYKKEGRDRISLLGHSLLTLVCIVVCSTMTFQEKV